MLKFRYNTCISVHIRKQATWLIMPKVFNTKLHWRRKAARDFSLPITQPSLGVYSWWMKPSKHVWIKKLTFVAKEGVAFRKYPALEERHGVDLGFAYKTDESAKTFTHFIAESQRQCFLDKCSSKFFYSFLMDGATDVGNVENKVVLMQYCASDDDNREIISCCRFLAIVEPTKADADGLIESLWSYWGLGTARRKSTHTD